MINGYGNLLVKACWLAGHKSAVPSRTFVYVLGCTVTAEVIHKLPTDLCTFRYL